MRGLSLLVLVLAPACKDKPAATPAPKPQAGDAQVLDAATIDAWATCKPALEAAATAPVTKRVQLVLDACQPCGPWTDILAWQTLPDAGGPDRRVLERAMTACDAWCVPAAKDKFMGVLDDARAKETRAPWRELGEACKEKVSASPDARYMSAAWFALDRIGRWAATQPNAQLVLDAVELAVPPVSLTGAGFALATAPVAKPIKPGLQLSVTATELSVGTLPAARLGAAGITVTGGPFPGDPIKPGELAARLAKSTEPIALIAPTGLPASRVAEAVKAAGGAPLQLAVTATSGVAGWNAYGVVPITLGAKVDPAGVTLALGASPDEAVKQLKAADRAKLGAAPVTVKLAPDATVAGLATVLGALAYFDLPRVTLVGSKP